MQKPLIIAILDLDRFKLYNDTHGHSASDQFLQDVAGKWLELLPADACLARIGGEELAIAIPDTPPATAREFLDTLCSIVPSARPAARG